MPIATSLTNQLLIAMPSMLDNNFSRAVTLLCQHDEDGAMGLIINRPTDFSLGELFTQLDLADEKLAIAQQTVLWGGPVQTDRGFVLHQDQREWPSTLRFGDGLAITTSREILIALAEGKGPDQCLVMLGYAGWGSEQLEFELSENAWLNAPVDNELLFSTPLELRWQAAARKLGIDINQLTDYSGRA